jgi:hypothetical protein
MTPFDRSAPLDDLPAREANVTAQIHMYEALAAALDRRKAVSAANADPPLPALEGPTVTSSNGATWTWLVTCNP